MQTLDQFIKAIQDSIAGAVAHRTRYVESVQDTLEAGAEGISVLGAEALAPFSAAITDALGGADAKRAMLYVAKRLLANVSVGEKNELGIRDESAPITLASRDCTDRKSDAFKWWNKEQTSAGSNAVDVFAVLDRLHANIAHSDKQKRKPLKNIKHTDAHRAEYARLIAELRINLERLDSLTAKQVAGEVTLAIAS
jgi:hypothetical protein